MGRRVIWCIEEGDGEESYLRKGMGGELSEEGDGEESYLMHRGRGWGGELSDA